MNAPEKRIAIAEACGWKYSKRGDWRGCYWIDPLGKFRSEIPDYLNDLNAIHEAEKVLSEGQMTTMSQYLHRRLGLLWGFATAAQRAEAFGLTLNLWK